MRLDFVIFYFFNYPLSSRYCCRVRLFIKKKNIFCVSCFLVCFVLFSLFLVFFGYRVSEASLLCCLFSLFWGRHFLSVVGVEAGLHLKRAMFVNERQGTLLLFVSFVQKVVRQANLRLPHCTRSNSERLEICCTGRFGRGRAG